MKNWSNIKQVAILFVAASIVAANLGSFVSFTIAHHRLPVGGGELVNWLLGL